MRLAFMVQDGILIVMGVIKYLVDSVIFLNLMNGWYIVVVGVSVLDFAMMPRLIVIGNTNIVR